MTSSTSGENQNTCRYHVVSRNDLQLARKTALRSATRFGGPLALQTALVVGLSSFSMMADREAMANPQNGSVVSGDATISQSGNILTIDQNSQNLQINWDNFSIGANETTIFNQPNASSLALNRVTGADPSSILGNLQSNGRVFLINPNGIMFGANSRVDVGALVATTSDIDPNRFNAGDYQFDIESPHLDASVINKGTISINDAGFAALVAPHVRNDGVIAAKLGTVEMASAQRFTLDLAGDGLLKIDLGTDPSLISDDFDALVDNSGTITADGGYIAIRAHTIGEVLKNVVNLDGYVQANTIGQQGGKVILGVSGQGKATVSADIVVKGDDSGENAGTVHLEADQLDLNQASIDASSVDATGGQVDITGRLVRLLDTNITSDGKDAGRIRVGGEFQGGKDLAEDEIRNADKVLLNDNTTLTASSNADNGDAGQVIIWSEEYSQFTGLIEANPGLFSGNGGLVEMSSKGVLNYQGVIRANDGTVLFDPRDITIINGAGVTLTANDEFADSVGTDVNISSADIVTLLNAGTNVLLQASRSIDIQDSMTSIGAGVLTLEAGGDIKATAGAVTISTGASDINFIVNSNNPAVVAADLGATPAGADLTNVTLTTTGDVAVTMFAGQAVSVGAMTFGSVSANNFNVSAVPGVAPSVNFTGTVTATGSISVNTDGLFTQTAATTGGNQFIAAKSGIAINAPITSTIGGIDLIATLSGSSSGLAAGDGNITQAVGGNITAATNFTAAGRVVTLDQATSLISGSSTLAAFDSLSAGSATSHFNGGIGFLDVLTNGATISTGFNMVVGNANVNGNLDITSTNSIFLGQAGGSDTLSLGALSAISTGGNIGINANMTVTGGVTLFATASGTNTVAAGDGFILSTDSIVRPVSVGGNLNLAAGDIIDPTSGNAIGGFGVTGATRIDVHNGITLAQPNNIFGGPVTLNANSGSLTSLSNLDLAASNIADDLFINMISGDLTQSGALQIGDSLLINQLLVSSATFASSNSASGKTATNIALNNSANAITTFLALSTVDSGGTSGTFGNVDIDATGDLEVFMLSLDGAFVSKTGTHSINFQNNIDITSTGELLLVGSGNNATNLSLNIGGDVILTSTAGDVFGCTLATCPTSTATYNVTGDVTMTAADDLVIDETWFAQNITLVARNSNVGDINAGIVADGIALHSDINASGNFTAFATQSGNNAVSASDGVVGSLDQINRTINVLGNVALAGLHVGDDNTDTTNSVIGAWNVSGTTTIDAHSNFASFGFNNFSGGIDIDAGNEINLRTITDLNIIQMNVGNFAKIRYRDIDGISGTDASLTQTGAITVGGTLELMLEMDNVAQNSWGINLTNVANSIGTELRLTGRDRDPTTNLGQFSNIDVVNATGLALTFDRESNVSSTPIDGTITVLGNLNVEVNGGDLELRGNRNSGTTVTLNVGSGMALNAVDGNDIRSCANGLFCGGALGTSVYTVGGALTMQAGNQVQIEESWTAGSVLLEGPGGVAIDTSLLSAGVIEIKGHARAGNAAQTGDGNIFHLDGNFSGTISASTSLLFSGGNMDLDHVVLSSGVTTVEAVGNVDFFGMDTNNEKFSHYASGLVVNVTGDAEFATGFDLNLNSVTTGGSFAVDMITGVLTQSTALNVGQDLTLVLMGVDSTTQSASISLNSGGSGATHFGVLLNNSANVIGDDILFGFANDEAGAVGSFGAVDVRTTSNVGLGFAADFGLSAMTFDSNLVVVANSFNANADVNLLDSGEVINTDIDVNIGGNFEVTALGGDIILGTPETVGTDPQLFSVSSGLTRFIASGTGALVEFHSNLDTSGLDVQADILRLAPASGQTVSVAGQTGAQAWSGASVSANSVSRLPDDTNFLINGFTEDGTFVDLFPATGDGSVNDASDLPDNVLDTPDVNIDTGGDLGGDLGGGDFGGGDFGDEPAGPGGSDDGLDSGPDSDGGFDAGLDGEGGPEGDGGPDGDGGPEGDDTANGDGEGQGEGEGEGEEDQAAEDEEGGEGEQTADGDQSGDGGGPGGDAPSVEQATETMSGEAVLGGGDLAGSAQGDALVAAAEVLSTETLSNSELTSNAEAVGDAEVAQTTNDVLGFLGDLGGGDSGGSGGGNDAGPAPIPGDAFGGVATEIVPGLVTFDPVQVASTAPAPAGPATAGPATGGGNSGGTPAAGASTNNPANGNAGAGNVGSGNAGNAGPSATASAPSSGGNSGSGNTGGGNTSGAAPGNSGDAGNSNAGGSEAATGPSGNSGNTGGGDSGTGNNGNAGGGDSGPGNSDNAGNDNSSPGNSGDASGNSDTASETSSQAASNNDATESGDEGNASANNEGGADDGDLPSGPGYGGYDGVSATGRMPVPFISVGLF